MNYWNIEAQRVIRIMLARSGMRRKRLVQGLRAIGVDTTEAAIANRIYRGTPSLVFVLQLAAVMGVEHLELELPRFSPHGPKRGADREKQTQSSRDANRPVSRARRALGRGSLENH